jgi:hypothetical protein
MECGTQKGGVMGSMDLNSECKIGIKPTTPECTCRNKVNPKVSNAFKWPALQERHNYAQQCPRYPTESKLHINPYVIPAPHPH